MSNDPNILNRPGEPDNEARKRLELFALKVHALVNQEETLSGCAGTLMGYAIGLMRRQGGTLSQVRSIFEQTLADVYDLPLLNTNPPTDPSEPS